LGGIGVGVFFFQFLDDEVVIIQKNLAKFQNMNVERSYLAPFHVVTNYIYIYIYIGIKIFKRIGLKITDLGVNRACNRNKN
jgi:hypothetical protein